MWFNDLTFHPTDPLLATVDVCGRLRMWSVPDLVVAGSAEAHDVLERMWIDEPVGASTVAFSPEGSMIATGGQDGLVLTWSYGGTLSAQDVVFEGEAHGIYAITFVSGSSLLAIGEGVGVLNLVDAESGNHVADVWAHEGGLNDIAADSNGAYLVTAGSDGLTIAWRRDGDQLVQIASRVHASSFGGVAVSGDGSWIYSAGYDDRVVRWSPEASASDDLTLKVNSWGPEAAPGTTPASSAGKAKSGSGRHGLRPRGGSTDGQRAVRGCPCTDRASSSNAGVPIVFADSLGL